MDTMSLWMNCFVLTFGLCQLNHVASQGTTDHLQDIFIGRCWNYQTKIRPVAPGQYKNCSELWQRFSTAFMNKDACSVTQDDYRSYGDIAMEDVPNGKSLFWEGTYQVTHDYSRRGRRKWALGDILIGYCVDQLTWCGQTAAPGVNYTRCPAYGECSSYDDAFWGMAATKYAIAASGEATTIMNGSRTDGRPAYERESYFAKFELPNLDPSKVTKFQVVVLHDVGKIVRESCNNGSLVQLKEDILKRGFEWHCTDDPEEMVHILCVDNVASPECTLARRSSPSNNGPHVHDIGQFKQLFLATLMIISIYLL
ncbi:unnamed protein product [Owenia fusiformis]|uniref:Uncharacterized protein n=1 Tax=Owenia fusiformis TaxID=6347 RepID=A0A8J1UFZ5_OWEFU|nr:unnamed protein product [Owenia fusiformis]